MPDISENENVRDCTQLNILAADLTVQQAGVSSTELTFKNQPTPNLPQPNEKKKKKLSGLDYFKALENKNKEAGTEKQAGLSPVTKKPITKQNQIRNKPNKIDQYLIEKKPLQNHQENKVKNQLTNQTNHPTNPETNPETSQHTNPIQLGLKEKITRRTTTSERNKFLQEVASFR